MRIFELPVPDWLRPDTQGFIWPPDCDDYGVEQDFELWLHESGPLSESEAEADWFYFPAYWNRWYWQNAETRHLPDGPVQDTLRQILAGRAGRVFTVAEYGLRGQHPEWNLNGLVVFTASRRGNTSGIDIPLLLHPHVLFPDVKKKWLASFAGNYQNDAVRWNMWNELKDKPDVFFPDEFLDIHSYTRLVQESYIVLAPRGVGVQSFRFYEAMQAGSVPLLISDVDSRPFGKWVDWDRCSLYRENHVGLYDFMRSIPLRQLVKMGQAARRVYHEQLQYGKWCPYLIATLEEMG